MHTAVSSWECINDSNKNNYELRTKDDKIITAKITSSNIIIALVWLEEINNLMMEGSVLVIPSKDQLIGIIDASLLVTTKKNVVLATLYENKSLMVREIAEEQLFVDMINCRVIQSETRLTEEAEEQIGTLLDTQRELTEVSIKDSDSESEIIASINELKEKLETNKKKTEKYLNSEEIEYLCQQEKISVKQELEDQKEQIGSIEISPKS